jgi:hypothetical protein
MEGGGERGVNEILKADCVIIASSYTSNSGQRSCNAARKMERNSLTVTIVLAARVLWYIGPLNETVRPLVGAAAKLKRTLPLVSFSSVGPLDLFLMIRLIFLLKNTQ